MMKYEIRYPGHSAVWINHQIAYQLYLGQIRLYVNRVSAQAVIALVRCMQKAILLSVLYIGGSEAV